MHAKDSEGKIPKIYEIAYLLVPLVAEEKVAEVAGEIMASVETHGGAVISSEIPKIQDLAYPVAKVLDRKRNYFDTAYFGWVKFEVSPEAIGAIDAYFKKHDSVLRHLVMISTRQVAPLPPRRRTEGKKKETIEASPESEKVMEAEINALIASTEDTKVEVE